MLEKQLTRKQFILSIGSFIGLLAVSGIPSALTGNMTKSLSENMKGDSKGTPNGYGNHHYGGKRA